MRSRLAGFVCPTVSMVTTGHATGVEKTLLSRLVYVVEVILFYMLEIKRMSGQSL